MNFLTNKNEMDSLFKGSFNSTNLLYKYSLLINSK